MPDEYISREAALMKLMQDGCSAKNLQSISDMPAADVAEVVHGRWVHETIEDDDWGGTYHSWSCSECKFSVGRNPTDENFCPNCGAKMDVGDGNSAMA